MRRARLVMWCLAAGAMVNVLVAWAAAVWSVPGPGSMAPVFVGYTPEVPPPALLWRTAVPDDWPPAPTHVMAVPGPGIAAQFGGAGQRFASVVRAGWPLLSLRSSTLRDAKGGAWTELTVLRRSGPQLWDRVLRLEARTSGGAPGVPVLSTRSADIKRRLPLEPIWAGFAGNTLVYAAAAALLASASGRARRVLRRRRGRCSACSYSMAGNTDGVCPECGARCHGFAALRGNALIPGVIYRFSIGTYGAACGPT